MGQYWIPVNLTKLEFIDPHKLSCGLKLWEQVASNVGTGTALLILCAAQREHRGGGDLRMECSGDPEYSEIAKRTIGRWAGDRIAIVGDYAEADDLPKKDMAHTIYGRCRNKSEVEMSPHTPKLPFFTDVTDDVCHVIGHELSGKFVGDGWRNFESKE